MGKQITKRFVGQVSHRMARRYILLPFTVPMGVRRLEVWYSFDAPLSNHIDLGLFDPRGYEFPASEGFRGWSGSAREHIVVTEHGASPGYLPGPLIPGIWHVLLGLAQVSSSGCRYCVEVLLSEEEGPLPERGFSAKKVLTGHSRFQIRTGPRWFRGDLHTHTQHSDAWCSVGELVAAARRRCLDFIAVTDHNTISHHLDLMAVDASDLLIIPGEEITTYFGHANAWGVRNWLDFRCRSSEEIAMIFAQAHQEGGLISVNHPNPGGPGWEFSQSLPFDCVEVWRGFWQCGNEYSLGYWEALLQKGRRVIAVGGSDTHPFPLPDGTTFDWLGYPTTWVYAKGLTIEGVLEGIKAGHVSISLSPTAARVTLIVRDVKGNSRAMQGDVVNMGTCIVEVHVVGGFGLCLRVLTKKGEIARKKITSQDWIYHNMLELNEHAFVRAEVRACPPHDAVPVERCPMVALTNPVWHADFIVQRKT